jgi:hypothetical protein
VPGRASGAIAIGSLNPTAVRLPPKRVVDRRKSVAGEIPRRREKDRTRKMLLGLKQRAEALSTTGRASVQG